MRAAIPEPDLVWYGRITRITNDTEVRVTTGTLTWEIEPVAGGAPIPVSKFMHGPRASNTISMTVSAASSMPKGNTKSISHDGLGRTVAVKDPDAGTSSHVYDAASSLIESTDAMGRQIRYTYDGANRILSEDLADENSPGTH